MTERLVLYVLHLISCAIITINNYIVDALYFKESMINQIGRKKYTTTLVVGKSNAILSQGL